MKGAHVVVKDTGYSGGCALFGVIYDPLHDYSSTEWAYSPNLTKAQAQALAAWLDDNTGASWERKNNFLAGLKLKGG